MKSGVLRNYKSLTYFTTFIFNEFSLELSLDHCNRKETYREVIKHKVISFNDLF